MNNLNVITKSFVVLIVIVMIAGGVIGGLMKDTDLVNFFRGKAEADQIQADTQKDIEQWEIEKPYYQKEREAESARIIAEINAEIAILDAKTQAEVDRIIGTAINQNMEDALKIEKESMWAGVMTSLVTYFGIGVCVIGCYVTVKVVNRNFHRGRFITWDRNVNVLDHDIYARRKAIAAARQRERDAIARSRHLLQDEGLYANDGYHTEVSR